VIQIVIAIAVTIADVASLAMSFCVGGSVPLRGGRDKADQHLAEDRGCLSPLLGDALGWRLGWQGDPGVA
jgi:hypothetical protein